MSVPSVPSVPKLVFRAKPLKLPVFKPKPVVEKVEVPEKPVTQYKFPPQMLLLIPFIIVGVRWLMASTEDMHKIKELHCRMDRHVMRCNSHATEGTFVVIIPSSCESVYEIGGVPFSSAGDDVYRVPAGDFTIRDIIGKCDMQTYLDSDLKKIEVPFTFITTKQHTRFSIEVDGVTVVENVVSSMFESVQRGNWIAYTYDVKGDTIKVIGDGTDVIHVYAPKTVGSSRLRP